MRAFRCAVRLDDPLYNFAIDKRFHTLQILVITKLRHLFVQVNKKFPAVVVFGEEVILPITPCSHMIELARKFQAKKSSHGKRVVSGRLENKALTPIKIVVTVIVDGNNR